MPVDKSPRGSTRKSARKSGKHSGQKAPLPQVKGSLGHGRAQHGRRAGARDRRSRLDQLEGRNPVFEALNRNRRRVLQILVDERARPVGKLESILELARKRGVEVTSTSRPELDSMAVGGVHNGVIALAEPLPAWTVSSRLHYLEERGLEPLFIAVDEAQYEQNLGAILRSALGAGASALVVPTARSRGCSPVVQRIAMGAAEEVPLIREGISSSLAHLKRRGLRIIGAARGGRPPWEADLTGPLVLVLGGEDKGLSATLRRRCEELVGIPLLGDLSSLNVGVSAGVLLFERVRQMSLPSGELHPAAHHVPSG